MSLNERVDEKDINWRIRKAAEEEFARRGYHEAVVDDIAERAGVGKGTVYRHYGDKEQLFLEITCFAARRLYHRLDRQEFARENLEGNLQKIARIHSELFKEARKLVRLIVREGFQFMGEEQSEFYEIIYQIIEEFQLVFEQGISSGEIDSSYDPQTLARFYLGRMWSIARGAIVFEEDLEVVKQKYNLAVDIFLHGIQ